VPIRAAVTAQSLVTSHYWAARLDRKVELRLTITEIQAPNEYSKRHNFDQARALRRASSWHFTYPDTWLPCCVQPVHPQAMLCVADVGSCLRQFHFPKNQLPQFLTVSQTQQRKERAQV